MTSPIAPRPLARHVLRAVAAVVGLLIALWILWFLGLKAFAGEGALPSKDRIPSVPAGAQVLTRSQDCGSGGCWWVLTVQPPPGQSPEDLARQMGLTHERHESPTLFDPGTVAIGAEPHRDRLVIHVGYQ